MPVLCIASKGDFEVTGWLRRNRLDESRFLLRHAEIPVRLAGCLALPG